MSKEIKAIDKDGFSMSQTEILKAIDKEYGEDYGDLFYSLTKKDYKDVRRILRYLEKRKETRK
jgi:hypothetical protein